MVEEFDKFFTHWLRTLQGLGRVVVDLVKKHSRGQPQRGGQREQAGEKKAYKQGQFHFEESGGRWVRGRAEDASRLRRGGTVTLVAGGR